MDIAQDSPPRQRSLGLRTIPRQGMRALVRWLIRLAVIGILFGWRRKFLATGVMLLAALSFWWFASSGTRTLPGYTQASGTGGQQVFSSIASSLPPAPAAERYLKGQSDYDAPAMWDSLSDSMKRSSTARGGAMTEQRLAEQLEENRRSGLRFDQANYVGGYNAPDGNSFYLYVVVVRAGSDIKYVPYTFTIGNEGKILSID